MTTTQTWTDLVSQGRELVRTIERSKFDLGDLARAIDEAELATFAEEIGVSHGVITAYRDVAAFWPEGYRDSKVSFSVYQELMKVSGGDPATAQREFNAMRAEGGKLTVDRLRTRHGKTPTRAPTDAQERAEYVKRQLADEEVRKEVAKDDSISSSFARDRDERARQERERSDQAQRERAPGLTSAHAVQSALSDMEAMKAKIGRTIDSLSKEELTEDQRRQLTARSDELVDAAELLRDFVGTGKVDFDRGIAEILNTEG